MRRRLLVLTAFVAVACAGPDRPDTSPAQAVSRIAAQAAGAQARAPAAEAERFVREFYAWYTPLARRASEGLAWNVVLQSNPTVLAPDLLRALRRDSLAQTRAKGEIDGLDFDPFLNSQDPCERYEVGRATPNGEQYRVEVRAICNGIRSSHPSVVAEVARNSDAWHLVNFLYPASHTDLRTVLHVLHPARS